MLFRSEKELNSPVFGTALILSVGGTYVDQGKFDLGITQMEKALTLYRSRGETSGESTTLVLLSEAWRQKGALDKALFYAKSVNIPNKRDDPLRASVARRILGTIYIEQKNYEEALRVLREAVEIQDKLQNPMWKADTLKMISGIYLKQGDFRKGIDYLKMVREIYKKEGATAAALRIDREIFWLSFYGGLTQTRKER